MAKIQLTENELRQIIKNSLNIILRESNEIFEEVSDEYQIYDLFEEFITDKRNGVSRKKWDVIPKNQYWNALDNYMTYGEAFRTPEYLIDEWLATVIKNTLSIQYITALCGHEDYFPISEVNEFFGENLKDYDELDEFLSSQNFYEWCKLPDGSFAISDYGLNPIFKILNELQDGAIKSEKLIAINRIIDVYHCRGDLASAFIEGGSNSCYEISNY